MQNQQTAGTISAIFGSDAMKAGLALITGAGTITTYIKDANQRRAKAASIMRRYGFGPVFRVINWLPHVVHWLLALWVMVTALIEILVIADQYASAGAGVKALPRWVQTITQFVSGSFVALFLIAVAAYIVFQLRLVEQILAWLLGLFPRFRQTLDWANAKWQIQADDSERRILAPSPPDVERAANKLVNTLVSATIGDSFAMRPKGLNDEEAANILYFGHVVEEYCAKTRRSFPWTVFYEALAKVAKTPGAPFSEKSLKSCQGPFSIVLLQANQYLPSTNQIPDEASLEQTVTDAFQKLRAMGYRADRAADGWAGTDYGRVLRKSKFLTGDDMRRQFAKLFILWNIKTGATRPKMFEIPFNFGMFIKYLDDGVMLAEGTRFDRTTQLVKTCFDAIHGQILKQTFELLNATKDPTRAAWREAEKKRVEDQGIDWTWWIYYRADTQTYHDARNYTSTKWRVEASKEVVKAGKPDDA